MSIVSTRCRCVSNYERLVPYARLIDGIDFTKRDVYKVSIVCTELIVKNDKKNKRKKRRRRRKMKQATTRGLQRNLVHNIGVTSYT